MSLGYLIYSYLGLFCSLFSFLYDNIIAIRCIYIKVSLPNIPVFTHNTCKSEMYLTTNDDVTFLVEEIETGQPKVLSFYASHKLLLFVVTVLYAGNKLLPQIPNLRVSKNSLSVSRLDS